MNRIQIPPLKPTTSSLLLDGTYGSLGPMASETIFPASSRSTKRNAGSKGKLRRGCQSNAMPRRFVWPSRDRSLARRSRSIVATDCDQGEHRALELLRRTQRRIRTLAARYREGPVTPRGVAVFEIGACPKVA